MWGVHRTERSEGAASISRAQRKGGVSGVSPDTNKVIPHLKAHKARLAHLLLLILGQVLDLRRGYLGLEEGLGVGAFEL